MLTDRLNVMDATAIVMCRENNLPLQVFNLFNAGDLLRIVQGEDVGTVVSRRSLKGESQCSRTSRRTRRSACRSASPTFRDQLKKLRTGRAHTSLIEHIKVDYYGSEMPLNQVANIATEDARTLTVTPWEKAMVPVIEKAIYKSDLGLTPNTAGAADPHRRCRPLTEERRRDITKVVRSRGGERPRRRCATCAAR